ncbi:DUF3649 domain-containing protein [Alloalcanivorax venustensis]|jgi:hypothetical protein|uniref:DUF3649 domain-containing protein n=1 Tax=Alloalcanivorax venustensis TaxID=172371 RepID=UPI003517B035
MSKHSLQRLAASPGLGVASRTLVAVFGGYALAACATTALALWLPAAPATAVITANLLSFLIYTVAVLWAFATRSAARAWVGIMMPALVLAALAWLGGPEALL